MKIFPKNLLTQITFLSDAEKKKRLNLCAKLWSDLKDKDGTQAKFLSTYIIRVIETSVVHKNGANAAPDSYSPAVKVKRKSDAWIDLNVGNMVVDIKKLKKDSSFNLDPAVGTLGIRG